MKIRYMLILVLSLISITKTNQVIHAETDESYPKIVYLDLAGCEVCQEVKDYGVLTGLESQGVQVIVYDVLRDPLMADQYAEVYGIEGGKAAPIIFAGDHYYRGASDIINAYDSGEIYTNAFNPLKDLDSYQARDFSFLTGLLLIIGAGLLDGINPCAIAMLLVFISMIGLTKNKKIAVIVSLSYIISIFFTYTLIGFGFLSILGLSRNSFHVIAPYLYGVFATITLILFVITLYDFFVTKNDEYGKVKNQLPKFIRKFNEKIIYRLSLVLDEKQDQRFALFWIIFVPVIIGILIGITEAACTGQIYVTVLASLHANNPMGIGMIEIFYILVFNLMFVIPLIVIAFLALKSNSIIGISNFMREHLYITKFITACFFLIMGVYFIYHIITL
ncbi:MAG: hypothetical protein ACLFRI_03395 [Candidatus Izemoplasmataceae bacterium]